MSWSAQAAHVARSRKPVTQLRVGHTQLKHGQRQATPERREHRPIADSPLGTRALPGAVDAEDPAGPNFERHRKEHARGGAAAARGAKPIARRLNLDAFAERRLRSAKPGFLSKLIIRRRLLLRAHFMRKVITRAKAMCCFQSMRNRKADAASRSCVENDCPASTHSDLARGRGLSPSDSILPSSNGQRGNVS